jgi:hypothetical protein
MRLPIPMIFPFSFLEYRLTSTVELGRQICNTLPSANQMCVYIEDGKISKGLF